MKHKQNQEAIVMDGITLRTTNGRLSTENYKLKSDDFNVKVKEQSAPIKPTTPPVSHKQLNRKIKWHIPLSHKTKTTS